MVEKEEVEQHEQSEQVEQIGQMNKQNKWSKHSANRLCVIQPKNFIVQVVAKETAGQCHLYVLSKCIY